VRPLRRVESEPALHGSAAGGGDVLGVLALRVSDAADAPPALAYEGLPTGWFEARLQEQHGTPLALATEGV
jgi:hypothetical protein